MREWEHRGLDQAEVSARVGWGLVLTECPSFLHDQVVEELKSSSCSQVLEKYDSFSTKVSPGTHFLLPTAHPVTMYGNHGRTTHPLSSL